MAPLTRVAPLAAEMRPRAPAVVGAARELRHARAAGAGTRGLAFAGTASFSAKGHENIRSVLKTTLISTCPQR